MFNESFSKIPTELIKSKAISNLEFRVLCVLIMISSYNNGHSYFGSFKLSDMCGIGRAALRKALNNLLDMHLITVTQRGSFSRSNDICLTLSDGIKFLQLGGAAKNTPTVDLKDSPSVDLKDSPKVDLKDSRVDLKDSPVDLKEPPIKKKDLNNLYLNKYNTANLNDSPYKNGIKEESATADVAAVRSMPCGEQVAAESLAKEACTADQAANTQDFIMLQTVKETFGDRFADLELFKVQNTYYVRQKGKFSSVTFEELNNFAVANGVFATSGHFFNERIISA